MISLIHCGQLQINEYFKDHILVVSLLCIFFVLFYWQPIGPAWRSQFLETGSQASAFQAQSAALGLSLRILSFECYRVPKIELVGITYCSARLET